MNDQAIRRAVRVVKSKIRLPIRMQLNSGTLSFHTWPVVYAVYQGDTFASCHYQHSHSDAFYRPQRVMQCILEHIDALDASNRLGFTNGAYRVAAHEAAEMFVAGTLQMKHLVRYEHTNDRMPTIDDFISVGGQMIKLVIHDTLSDQDARFTCTSPSGYGLYS